MENLYPLSEFPLVRFLKSPEDLDFKPKGYEHLVIIGNGAVMNGWEPVLKTLREHKWLSSEFQSPLFRNPTSSTASYCLSVISFVFRILRNGFLRSPEKVYLLPTLEEINEFKNELCRNFKEAENDRSISLRKDLKSLLDHIGTENSFFNTGYITLNWDELFWSRKNEFPNLIQLHGRVGLPHSLILPTELSIDENILEILQRKKVYDISNEHHLIVGKLNVYNELNHNHHLAVNWLENVKRLFIWGVNFNEYDCELNSILFVAKNTSIEEVIILDPRCFDRVSFLSKVMNIDSSRFKCIQIGDL